MEEMTSPIFEVLQQIESPHGHVIKLGTQSEISFEEAYVSSIRGGSVSGWKMHRSMVSRLVVIQGAVRFVFPDLMEKDKFQVFELNRSLPGRLTIYPGSWFGFKGLEETNSILNLASEIHRPDEVEKLDLSSFVFDWSGT